MQGTGAGIGRAAGNFGVPDGHRVAVVVVILSVVAVNAPALPPVVSAVIDDGGYPGQIVGGVAEAGFAGFFCFVKRSKSSSVLK